MSPAFKLGIHLSEINFRGTTVATMAYARGLASLGVKLFFFAPASGNHNRKIAEDFRAYGPLEFYQTWPALERRLGQLSVEALYVLKSGERDGLVSAHVPTWVHAVFPTEVRDFHGNSFAFVSEWLSNFSSCGAMPWVPHAVRRPKVVDGLREKLSIPSSATVLGCYGGTQSFDIRFARLALEESLKNRRDLFAIFRNIERFTDHPQAIFLPGTADLLEKDAFVTACDAMLHARAIGETFGLACAEFSAANKPVITYRHSHQKAHLHMLGRHAIVYSGYASLKEVLCSISKKEVSHQCWDAFGVGFDEVGVSESLLKTFLGRPLCAVNNATRLCVSWNKARWRLERQWRKFKLGPFTRV